MGSVVGSAERPGSRGALVTPSTDCSMVVAFFPGGWSVTRSSSGKSLISGVAPIEISHSREVADVGKSRSCSSTWWSFLNVETLPYSAARISPPNPGPPHVPLSNQTTPAEECFQIRDDGRLLHSNESITGDNYMVDEVSVNRVVFPGTEGSRLVRTGREMTGELFHLYSTCDL